MAASTWIGTRIMLHNDLSAVVVQAEKRCPGVFYLSAKTDDGQIKEVYAVSAQVDRDIISDEATCNGWQQGNFWFFEKDDNDSYGWGLIHFEVLHYMCKTGCVTQETLYCAALSAAERYPEYFGGLIPPAITPYGLTIRVHKAFEGVFFLETDKCRWLLALAYPVWHKFLNVGTWHMGEFCCAQYSREESWHLCFSSEHWEPVIAELVKHPQYIDLYRSVPVHIGKSTMPVT